MYLFYCCRGLKVNEDLNITVDDNNLEDDNHTDTDGILPKSN